MKVSTVQVESAPAFWRASASWSSARI